MTAQTFSSIPAMKLETTSGSSNPLRAVLVTVFTLKLVVAAFLVATVSLAPPVSAESRYMASN